MRLGVATVVALIATVCGQSSLQGSLDLYCQQARSGDIGYVARYIAANNVPNAQRIWRCVNSFQSPGLNDFSATTTAEGCVTQTGVCTMCGGAVVGTSLIFHPELMSSTEIQNFPAELGVTTGNRTADLLIRIARFSTRGTWFCPTLTGITWNATTSQSIVVKQLSMVKWTWTDLRSVVVRQQSITPPADGTLQISDSGAVSIGGAYNTTFLLPGVVNYFSLAAPGTIRTLVVQDANECSGEGQTRCPTTSVCQNVVGSFYCLTLCGRNGSATCSAAEQACLPFNSGSVDGCGCASGYTGQDTCTDFDECAIGIDTCDDPQHVCSNTAGSFSCSCNRGYEIDGIACRNINECDVDTDNCNAMNGTCTDNAGSFTCACNVGYRGNGLLICNDIDECTETNTCDDEATCTNTISSFTCSCNPGYSGDGQTCANVDECFDNVSSCSFDADCTDTVGSFTCACNVGYNGSGVVCTDIDECTLNIDDCHANAMCANSTGSFSCSCMPGYSGDGITCTTIDECDLSMDSCSPIQLCVDTVGSFTCNAINECADETDTCDVNANCTDLTTGRGYACGCNLGYSGTGDNCVDVDECELFPCSDVCSNVPGSFYCVCNSTGRELVAPMNAICRDIDECAREIDNCDMLASCMDISDSFLCSCIAGYSGDGLTCANINECDVGGSQNCNMQASCADTVGSFTCACNAGWSGIGTTCTNVNECSSLQLHTCRGNATCIDAQGSYSCACNNGYGQTAAESSDLSMFQCTDFTGCASNPCENRGVCSTVPGNFSCGCDGTGFNGRRCTETIDECAQSGGPNGHNCHTRASCFDTFGSFMCACNSGWTGDGRSCTTIDECALNIDDCHPLGDCTNTVGSFTCSCNSSRYSGDGVFCALRTVGFSIELVTLRTGFVGVPIPFRIVARDADGRVLTTEQNDVLITVDTSRIHVPITVEPFWADVTNGQVVTSFTASVAGIYTIGMQASNRNGLDDTLTQQLWFATNSSFRIPTDTGIAQISSATRFTNVPQTDVSDLWFRDFVTQFSDHVIANSHYRGFFGNTGITATNSYGPLLARSKVAWFEVNRAMQVMSFTVGLAFNNSNAAMVVDNTVRFWAHLHSQTCASGSGGLAVNPNRQNLAVENEAHVELLCDSSGLCVGSASIPWVPNRDLTGLSVIVVDSQFRDVLTPRIFCADLNVVNKSLLLNVGSLEAGGVQFNYLASDIATRTRRQVVTSPMFVTYTINVPEIGASDAAERILAMSSGPLITALRTKARLNTSFSTSVARVATVPSVSLSGFDCSTDAWSAWTGCIVPGSAVPNCPIGSIGIRSRVRRCFVESSTQRGQFVNTEAQTCTSAGPCAEAAACGDANNGGCDDPLRASCSMIMGVPSCACETGYTGNGSYCIVSESDSADIEETFIAPLHLIATTQAQQRTLLSLITASANSAMGLTDSSRNFGVRLTSTLTSFTVYYTILPRTIYNPTLTCTAAQALNAASLSRLAVLYGTTLLTPAAKIAVCPGQLPTFTTTTMTATTITVTATTRTVTETSTTFYNASAPRPTNASFSSGQKSNGANEWDEEYTIYLVGALLIVFGVLMSVGLVCAVRENSKRKILELGLLVNPSVSPFATGPPTNQNNQNIYGMKVESGPGEEQKWLQEQDPNHFYPSPGIQP